MEKKPVFVPIPCDIPAPKHTQVKARCFTCTKFPVCSIRIDYLKTLQLMENILGDPADDLLYANKVIRIPNFDGKPYEDAEKYFSTDLKTLDDDIATFYDFRYTDEDNFKIMYIINKYLVMFEACYDKEKQNFNISKGTEVYYGLQYELTLSSSEELGLECELLREKLIEEKVDEKDVINTTAFSASLECDFYQWERGLTYEEGIKRICAKYPDGIPIDDCGNFFHLATFHIEDNKVPCFNPCNDKVAFMPMPYAIPCQPPKVTKCCKKVRRDEQTE